MGVRGFSSLSNNSNGKVYKDFFYETCCVRVCFFSITGVQYIIAYRMEEERTLAWSVRNTDLTSLDFYVWKDRKNSFLN